MVTAKVCSCNSSADLGLMVGGQDTLERMQSAVTLLLRGLGEDPSREGLRETPRRVARAWLDIASGYTQECTRAFGKALFHEPIISSGSGGMVVVRDIMFAAMCEHTLLPFHGRCHIAYVPRGGVILGLSKLARVTKCLASKLQQQELFTHNLMAAIQQEVGPAGVVVVVQANHLGGPCQPITQVTSAASGCFQDSRSGLLVEFLTLLRLSGISDVSTLLNSTQHGAAATAKAAAASGAACGPLTAPPHQLQHFAWAAASSTQAEAPQGDSSVLDMATAVKALLEGVGEVPCRPGLEGSPERYVQWLFAATAGYHMSLPLPACVMCESQPAPTDAPAAAGEVEALRSREGSPEAPATPADQSPGASCASSDVAADEPLPCSSCLGSSPRHAELGLEEPPAGQQCCELPPQQQELQAQLNGHSCGADEREPRHQQLLEGEAQQQPGGQRSMGAGRMHTFSTQFASQCEHHLLPFYGTLRLAYQLPDGGAEAGSSSARDERAAKQQLQHIVDMYSKRLQVQERLSHQVADAALGALKAAAVLVVVDSAHMCMVARGVEKHASTTLTTASRGLWAADALARAQAMEVLLSR